MTFQKMTRPAGSVDAAREPREICRLGRRDNFHIVPTPAPTQARSAARQRAEQEFARLLSKPIEVVRLPRRSIAERGQ